MSGFSILQSPIQSPFRGIRVYFFAAIIIVATAISYWPSLKNDFTNWDDPSYVLNNPSIKKLDVRTIKRSFSEYHMGNYHPLTMISLAIDYKRGGLEAKYYHQTNFLLHILNSLMVFVLIILLFKNAEIAFVCALLFGIHPIHVESVAWVSERKDVLYAFFFLVSLIFYTSFQQTKKLQFYLISLLAFVLSLFSKGMAVSLTITLFAIDFLMNRDFFQKKIYMEKIPFVILSIIFGLVAIKAQTLGPDTAGIPDYNIFNRLLFATYGLVQYLFKLIIPISFIPFYPYPSQVDLSMIIYPLITALLVGLMIYYRKVYKPFLFCALFFLINLLLVLQILPVGKAVMADRYAYIPSIGFFLFVALFLDTLKNKFPEKKIFFLVPLAIIAAVFSHITVDQCKVWNNSLSLWSHTISKNPNIDIAYNNRGVAYAELNDLPKALGDYTNALNLNPKHTEAYNNRGIIHTKLQNSAAAFQDYNTAIALNQNYEEAYYNRGNAFAEIKNYTAAIIDYTRVLQINPGYAPAYNNRGMAKKILEDLTGAEEDFTQAISLEPQNADAYRNRALVRGLLKNLNGAKEDAAIPQNLKPDHLASFFDEGIANCISGNFKAAIEFFNKSLEVNPTHAESYGNRGLARYNLKDYLGAMQDYQAAINLNKDYKEAYFNRANAKSFLRDYKGAIEDYNKVIQLDPENFNAYGNRGIAKLSLEELHGSIKDFDKSIKLNPLYAEGFCNRGLAMASLKKFPESIADYTKAISLNPKFGLAYNNRGVVYYNSNKKILACEDWKIAQSMGDMNSSKFLSSFCK